MPAANIRATRHGQPRLLQPGERNILMSQFFIDRPIFATVVSIVILIVGGVALIGMPVAQYPEIVPPTVSIQTVYPGAGAQVVADTVTTPIEQEVNGVEDMLFMASKSTTDGQSVIDVTFNLGTDIDQAQVLTQNRVAVALAKLPDDVKRQGVTTKKKSPSILLCVNLISPDGRFDLLYLSNYALIQVRDALARLDGVGDVAFLGARDYAMRVWLDPDALAARGLAAADVVRALREQNVQVASGQLGQEPSAGQIDFQVPVTTLGRLPDAAAFGKVIVKSEPGQRAGETGGRAGRIVRLADVARVELGAKNADMTSWLDAAESVTIAVFQLPGSNALATARRVREEMDRLAERFPEGLEYRIHYDTTVFVDESIREVIKTLFEATVLVFVVVLVFLQQWRATLVPMAAVPVSLVGTFAVMRLLGFSFNNLSLFGLVLAIGIVVDDAIVVVENVERWIREGLSAREATKKAMREVTGPIVATTLVLAAVFVPTAFIAGISGQFYRQFALTIAASTVISTVVSLSLAPALCVVLFQGHAEAAKPGGRGSGPLAGFFRVFNLFFDVTTGAYGTIVGLLLRAAIVVVAGYLGLMALTYVGFTSVPLGFIPEQDKGYLVVNCQLPDGASLQRTEPVVARLEREVLATPGVAHTISVAGYSLITSTNLSNAGGMFVLLEPFAARAVDPDQSAGAIARRLRRAFADIPEAVVSVFPAPPVEGMGNTGGFKLQLQDRTAAGPAALQESLESLAEAAAAQPGLAGITTTFRANAPQVFVEVDRAKARAQGVPITAVNEALQFYLGSGYANDFTAFGRNWQVTVQADAPFRMRPEAIGQLKVPNTAGEMVPLATLVSVRDSSGPAIVNHYNLYPSAELSGATLPGTSSGDAIAILDSLAAQPPAGRGVIPPGMGIAWTDLSLQQILAGDTAVYVFVLGTVFVFLVLAAQYESWALPLAVILIVPMCLLAAIAGVWLAGLDNNIFTQIGLVVLIGLAAKNAILIVEFARQRQQAGATAAEAVLEAAVLRLRPILMTSLAFILGVIPLVLGTGAGAEMRRALGTAVFSGMLGVTVFGIFFTPVFYSIVMRFAGRSRSTGGG
ncbi:MAG: multidrug efflux RND transporter permease subunit [Planctomycetota bacterium]|nr:multidrug efflux RND transporter permease subunit [Planctomycetota bacterium]